jgi:MFS family permease|tara:strand:+ start:399 stop:1655 length:1257 start_codon:yes stop_codon:yes gene_type:complete
MGKQIGYMQLLRRNKEFRRLFIANEISFIGDWFTVIALFILAGEASGDSPLAIAGVLASRSFSLALFTPFTGMLADRFSRRGLMVLANVLSFGILIVVLLTGVHKTGLVSVYALAVVIVAARAVHDPAEYAYLPNICDENELLTANALASGGWSVALGVGAAIGGLTIAEFGITTALWIDTTTFLVAAMMLSMLPHGGPDATERGATTPRVVFDEMVGGWKYILSSPPLRRVVFAKGLWASGGGAQILILILISAEAGFGEIAAGAIGVLFMVRGFGSGFGPIAGRPLMANMRLRPYLLGLAVGTCGAFYVGVSLVEWGGFMLVLIFLAHAASGLNWVLSTTLLQERSADEWRGRVAGTDHFVITLMMGISAVAGGYILTENILDLRELIAVTGLVQITLCILWIALVSGPEKRMLQA